MTFRYPHFNLTASLEMVLDSKEDYVTSEMEKQKRKLKDMSKLMEQQHQLLRLIVQVIHERDDVARSYK